MWYYQPMIQPNQLPSSSRVTNETTATSNTSRLKKVGRIVGDLLVDSLGHGKMDYTPRGLDNAERHAAKLTKGNTDALIPELKIIDGGVQDGQASHQEAETDSTPPPQAA